MTLVGVAEAASSLEEVRFLSVGHVDFKNVVDPVAVFEVLAGIGVGDTIAVDPVCRMQVRPESAPARLPFEARTFFFCSFDCARLRRTPGALRGALEERSPSRSPELRE